MGEYIYRYISFESFVDMVQRQDLTFVLPSMWDDTAELQGVYRLIMDEDEWINSALYLIWLNKTYAQCWTRLSESDAMWRIYAYGNKALRIKIDESSVSLLPNVQMTDVFYSDTFEIKPVPASREETLLKAFSLKRKAFEHEHEVRLVSYYKFHGEEDLKEHLKAALALTGNEAGVQIIKSRGENIEETIDSFIDMMNLKAKQKTKEISFAQIPDFIKGVQVHPLGPQWYVQTVKQYCSEHNIAFEGKSTLYSKFK